MIGLLLPQTDHPRTYKRRFVKEFLGSGRFRLLVQIEKVEVRLQRFRFFFVYWFSGCVSRPHSLFINFFLGDRLGYFWFETSEFGLDGGDQTRYDIFIGLVKLTFSANFVINALLGNTLLVQLYVVYLLVRFNSHKALFGLINFDKLFRLFRALF